MKDNDWLVFNANLTIFQLYRGVIRDNKKKSKKNTTPSEQFQTPIRNP